MGAMKPPYGGPRHQIPAPISRPPAPGFQRRALHPSPPEQGLTRQRRSVDTARLGAPEPCTQSNKTGAQPTLRQRVPARGNRPIPVTLIEDRRRLVISPRRDRNPRLNVADMGCWRTLSDLQVANVKMALRAQELCELFHRHNDIPVMASFSTLLKNKKTAKTPRTKGNSALHRHTDIDSQLSAQYAHTHPVKNNTEVMSVCRSPKK